MTPGLALPSLRKPMVVHLIFGEPQTPRMRSKHLELSALSSYCSTYITVNTILVGQGEFSRKLHLYSIYAFHDSSEKHSRRKFDSCLKFLCDIRQGLYAFSQLSTGARNIFLFGHIASYVPRSPRLLLFCPCLDCFPLCRSLSHWQISF